MSIQVTEEIREGTILILRLKGRLDAVALPILEKQINQHIAAGKKQLLLDFTEVEYLSSAGMRLLLSTTKKIKSLEGKMAVSSISDNVMQIIKLAGFDLILTITSSEAQALEVLKVV